MNRATDHRLLTRARMARVRVLRGTLACAGAVLAIAMLAATPAAAAGARGSGFYIRGGGDGHGIGMSQYGAGGLALHGWSWQKILQHYYIDTTLAHVSPSRTVTVLLAQGAATFHGATTIAGSKTKLNPGTNYGVIPVAGGKLELIHSGIKVGIFNSPLKVSGRGPLDLIGAGLYRGGFLFRHLSGVVQTVNALGVDDYVRGVVSAEMPASWAQQALDAQAVAARTYVLTTDVAPGEYDAYDDTRSQMYEGVRAETSSTNAAVKATSGEVVEYHGSPVTTYFFASSGGYTESIQNVWYGVEPEAWLHGEPDPYDNAYSNPYYRWRRNLSVRAAGGSLGGYYHGSLRGIQVVKHGVSPRIVEARVIGTHGSSTLSGAELQSLFGTMSTYMAFTEIHDRGMVVSAAAARRARAARARAARSHRHHTSTKHQKHHPKRKRHRATARVFSHHRLRSHSGTGGAGLGSGSSSGSGSASGSGSTSGSGSASPPPSTSLNKTPTRAGRYVQGTIFPAVRKSVATIELRVGRGWKVVARQRLSGSGAFRVRVARAGIYRVLYGGIYGPWVDVK